MKLISEKDLFLRASRGTIQGWYSDKQPTTDRPALDLMLQAYRTDPTVRGAVTAISDEVLKNGYLILSENKRLKTRVEKDLKVKYRFPKLLKKIVNNALIYGNVFIEVVYKGTSAEELHVLETTEMEIVADKHGEVNGYIQRAKATDSEITFTTDEVMHLSLEHIKSNLWAEVPMKTLFSILNLKLEIEKFMTNLFKFNKFRDAWSIEEADEVQIKDFINNLRLSQEMPEKEMVIDGKISKILGRKIEDLDKLIEILNYCRQEILTLLRVPPIIAGIPDNSNRSNSEIQARKAFDTHIKSIQQSIEEEVDYELFPKMGWATAEFKFKPIDKRTEKEDIEIIAALKAIGLDNESLLHFIRDSGIQIRDNAKIETPEVPGFNGKDPFPESRKPVDKGKDLKEERGEASSTREDQLMGRSETFVITPDDVDEVLGSW